MKTKVIAIHRRVGWTQVPQLSTRLSLPVMFIRQPDPLFTEAGAIGRDGSY